MLVELLVVRGLQTLSFHQRRRLLRLVKGKMPRRHFLDNRPILTLTIVVRRGLDSMVAVSGSIDRPLACQGHCVRTFALLCHGLHIRCTPG